MDRHRNQHALFAASWLIAGYYGSGILRTLCQLLSVNLFFASANIVPGALFYRNKEFKFIAVRSFIIQIAGGAGAITAALCGAGLYALIINPILSSILIFVISYQRYPQRLRFTLGLKVLRKIFSYSAYQFLFNVINYFSRNLDKLLIGKYMSMSALGYYEKSYRLMMLPLQNITQVITPVMHPIFSDFQNDKEKLATSYERIVRFLSFIGLPLSVLLFFTAEEVTLIILVINGCLRFLYSGYCHFRSVFRSYSLLQVLFFRQQVIQGASLSADSFRPYSM